MNAPAESSPTVDYKYWAFISYSHQDNLAARADGTGGHIQWANWLHGQLETYSIPDGYRDRATRTGEPMPERFFPAFRDEAELPTSHDLGGQIRDALRRSRFLIVIASPRSARSRYVNEEVRYFRELGRGDRILTLMVDGQPNVGGTSQQAGTAGLECFCPELLLSTEPLAADVRVKDRGPARELRASERHLPSRRVMLHQTRLKLIAGLMGVGLDDLIQRDKNQARVRAIRMLAAVACVLAVIALLVFNASSARKGEDVQTRQKAALQLANAAVAQSEVDPETALVIARRAWLLDEESGRANRAEVDHALRTSLESITAEWRVPAGEGRVFLGAALSPDGRFRVATSVISAPIFDKAYTPDVWAELRNSEVREARTATAAPMLSIWDGPSYHPINVALNDLAVAVIFFDATHFAVVGFDAVTLWDANKPAAPEAAIPIKLANPRIVSSAPARGLIALRLPEGEIGIVDLRAPGKPLVRVEYLAGDESLLGSMSPDGRWLVLESHTFSPTIFDLSVSPPKESRIPRSVITLEPNVSVMRPVFLDDRTLALMFSSGRTLIVSLAGPSYQFAEPRQIPTFLGLGVGGTSLSIQNGRVCIPGASATGVLTVDLRDRIAKLRSLPTRDSMFVVTQFDEGVRNLLAASKKAISVWSLEPIKAPSFLTIPKKSFMPFGDPLGSVNLPGGGDLLGREGEVHLASDRSGKWLAVNGRKGLSDRVGLYVWDMGNLVEEPRWVDLPATSEETAQKTDPQFQANARQFVGQLLANTQLAEAQNRLTEIDQKLADTTITPQERTALQKQRDRYAGDEKRARESLKSGNTGAKPPENRPRKPLFENAMAATLPRLQKELADIDKSLSNPAIDVARRDELQERRAFLDRQIEQVQKIINPKPPAAPATTAGPTPKGGGISALCFSHDGRKLIAAIGERLVIVDTQDWNASPRSVAIGREVAAIKPLAASSVQTIGLVCRDGTMEVWNLETGAPMQQLTKFESAPLEMLTNSAGSLITVEEGGRVSIWATPRNSDSHAQLKLAGPLAAAGLSAGGEYLAVVSSARLITTIDLKRFAPMPHSVQVPGTEKIRTVVPSSDGTRCFVGFGRAQGLNPFARNQNTPSSTQLIPKVKVYVLEDGGEGRRPVEFGEEWQGITGFHHLPDDWLALATEDLRIELVFPWTETLAQRVEKAARGDMTPAEWKSITGSAVGFVPRAVPGK